MTNGLSGYLKRERAARGWTQQDLAEHAGFVDRDGNVDRSPVAGIESGRTKVGLAETRRKIAVAFGVRHVDMLVAAGELSEEEVATVAPRWPTSDQRRTRLFETIEALPDGWLDSVAVVLGAMALAAAADQTPESPPSPPR